MIDAVCSPFTLLCLVPILFIGGSSIFFVWCLYMVAKHKSNKERLTDDFVLKDNPKNSTTSRQALILLRAPILLFIPIIFPSISQNITELAVFILSWIVLEIFLYFFNKKTK